MTTKKCDHVQTKLFTINGKFGLWQRIYCAQCGLQTELVLSYALARQLWNEVKSGNRRPTTTAG